MTRFDLSDDDALLAHLSDAINQADPVPSEAVTTAKTLAQLGEADAELATLVADTLLDGDIVLLRHDVTMEQQGESSDRLVSFAAPQLSVDVDLNANGATVLGVITPPISADVDLETAKGTVTTRSDDLGRFHIEAGSGPCRLRIHANGGAVVTPWITR
ncbi:MAG: hypothetical protein M3083_05475 [Actinomycetota bacterium]|nr:hypothetical protein [Actinomycetota bacterium]